MAQSPEAVLSARPGSRILRRGFARSVSGVFLLQITSIGFSVITGIVLGRFLGPRGYGAYVFAMGWIAVLCVPAVLGLDKVLIRTLPAYDVKSAESLIHGLFRRTSQLVLLLGVSIGVIACAAGALLLSAPFRTPFLIATFLVPIMSLTLLRTGGMMALDRVAIGQLPESVIQPAIVITTLLAVHFVIGRQFDAATATVITVGAATLAFAVGQLLLRRAIPSGVKQSSPRYATREWLALGLPMMLVAGIWLLDSYASILVVGSVGGAHAVGVFAVVIRGGQIVPLVLIALIAALAPRVARLYALGEKDEAQRLVYQTAWVALAGALPFALVLIAFRHQCLALFGNGFTTGGLALIIVVAGQLVNAGTGPAATVLSMTGHVSSAGVGVGVGLVINIGLCIALVPGMGVDGAAIATAGGTTVRNLLLVALARRQVGLDTSLVRTTRFPSRVTTWPGGRTNTRH